MAVIIFAVIIAALVGFNVWVRSTGSNTPAQRAEDAADMDIW